MHTATIELHLARTLVAEASTAEAIAVLRALLRDGPTDLRDSATLLEGRMNAARRAQVEGVASAQVDAQLAAATLKLAGLVEQRRLHLGGIAASSAVNGLEKIIGANRIKSTAWLRQGLLCAKAVGRLGTRAGFATGFLVGASRLVTNWHVLPSQDACRDAVLRMNYEEPFGDSPRRPADYRLDPTTHFASEELDVASVVVVEGDGPRVSAWGTIELSERPPVRGDYVSIIQHPGGRTKSLAISENTVTDVLGPNLQYTTDTEPGSSGSPVLSDDWKLVAVHRRGGNLASTAGPVFINEGVLANRALAALGDAINRYVKR